MVGVFKELIDSGILTVKMEGKQFKAKLQGRPYFNLTADILRSQLESNFHYLHNKGFSTVKIYAFINSEGCKKEIEEWVSEQSNKVKFASKETISALEEIESLFLLEFPNPKVNEDRYIFFNPITGKTTPYYDLPLVQELFKEAYAVDKGLPAEYFAWRKKARKICTKVFRPREEKLLCVDKEKEIYDFNSYELPEYRKNLVVEEITKEEERLFTKYLKHLFPDKEHLRYVMAWVYTSLVARQQTFLCLIGPQGTGKTLFMSMISRLHGEANTAVPKDANAHFNGFLSSKTFVMYDEVEVDDAAKEKFKRIANTIIQIEKKGRDQEDTKNFSSVILATNTHSMVSVEPNDRRFSFPDLGKKRLEEVLGEEGTTKLFQLSNEDRFYAWLYNFLIQTFEETPEVRSGGKFAPTKELIHTRSWELCCLANAPMEISFTLDIFKMKSPTTGEIKYPVIEFQELKELFKKYCRKDGLRIPKKGIMYSIESFSNKIFKYQYKGKPLVEIEGEKIINLHNWNKELK